MVLTKIRSKYGQKRPGGHALVAPQEYLQPENQSLREQLGKKRICWTDAQRQGLAEKVKAVGWSRSIELLHLTGTARTGNQCRDRG
jgi:hypothetical protein